MSMEPTHAELEAEINALAQEAGPAPEVAAAQAVEQAAAVDAQTAVKEYEELLQPILGMSFAIIAPAWAINDTEVKQLSEAYAPLIHKYWPDGPQKFGPEIGAGLVTVAIFSSRIGRPRKVGAAANDAGPEPEPVAQVERVPGEDVAVPAGVAVDG